MKILFGIALLSATILTACKKDEPQGYNAGAKAPVSIEFDNIAGSSDLQLNTGTYINALGQSFTVSKLKYYVSNFSFTNTEGTTYTVPQSDSYFLIDESVPASLRPVVHIPEGEYVSFRFMIGVDSLRNTMDVSHRTGVLDVSGPATDMYWSWNSGYIFLKLEGNSPAVTGMGGLFQYHVGGFGGYSTPTINNLTTITVDLRARGAAKVRSGRTPNVHLFTDILKAISGGSNLDFSTTPMIHSPAAAVPIRNNYSTMISHDHTEN